MKKVVLLVMLWILSLNFSNAYESSDYQKLCEWISGKYVALESYPVQEFCSINWKRISMDSFKDKYDKYVLWIMKKYATEYKYSDTKKWSSYEEFFTQDIQDTKNFREFSISDEIKEKVNKDLKVQASIYNSTKVRNDLWEKNAGILENALIKYEAKFKSETELNKFYKLLQWKLTKKVEEMEKIQMVSRFTEEWYKNFLFKLNAYKYLLILVNGRLE